MTTWPLLIPTASRPHLPGPADVSVPEVSLGTMDPGYQLTAENYEEKFHVYFTVYHEYMPDLIITVLG